MKNQQSGTRSREYVRKLPHIPQEQIIAASRKQAIQEADPSYSGHHAGIHPEHQPYLSDDYDLEEGDEYYQTRLPTSTRRYQQLPDGMTAKGRVNVVSHYHDQPLRAHRQQLPPPRQQEQYADEIEHIRVSANRRIHPLVWLGVFGILLVSGWIGLNFVTAWYQGVQNDWTYGTKRHFEIDAVVGHSDSQTNPSHFTAENTNGQIIVIELPGGNVSKAKIYQIETVPGNNGNPPVKLSFQDINGDGKPDMLVQIGDGNALLYVTLFNNGSQFVSKL